MPRPKKTILQVRADSKLKKGKVLSQSKEQLKGAKNVTHNNIINANKVIINYNGRDKNNAKEEINDLANDKVIIDHLD